MRSLRANGRPESVIHRTDGARIRRAIPSMNSISRILPLAVLALSMGACTTVGGALRVPPLPAEARTRSARFVVVTVRNESRPLAREAASTPRGYDAAAAYGVTAVASNAVRALERTYGLKQVSAWPITSLRVHCIVFRVPPSIERSALIAQLARDPHVESAQPLNDFTAQSAPDSAASWMPYNDPYAPLQRALRELHVIDAQRTSRGAGVAVAIIDTGVDLQHPDLAGRIVAHRNFVDGDERQFMRDRHGTEVAGVIAADANNAIGIVGIAPEAHLLAYKACWQSQSDPALAFCNSFTLAQALEAAIRVHADIVNLSLAGPPDPLLARLERVGEAQGILFTGAVPPPANDSSGATRPRAGSEPSAPGPPTPNPSPPEGFPTGVPGVLAVESAEDGPRRSGDLLAPGREILTLVPGGHYDFASGSSLATAEVTGILALMISGRARLPAPEAAHMLADSSGNAVDGEAPALVDACRALLEARGAGICPAGAGSTRNVKATMNATR